MLRQLKLPVWQNNLSSRSTYKPFGELATVSYCLHELMEFAQLSWRWLGYHHLTYVWNFGQLLTRCSYMCEVGRKQSVCSRMGFGVGCKGMERGQNDQGGQPLSPNTKNNPWTDRCYKRSDSRRWHEAKIHFAFCLNTPQEILRVEWCPAISIYTIPQRVQPFFTW